MDLVFGIATIDRLLINRQQPGLEMKKGLPTSCWTAPLCESKGVNYANLRASCFIRRTCLRWPLGNRFFFVLLVLLVRLILSDIVLLRWF